MKRNPSLVAGLAFGLALALDTSAAARAQEAPSVAETPAAPVTGSSTNATPAIPPMRFASSVLDEALLEALKENPALAPLEAELPGSPLALVVTHSLRTTAGGQAAGLLSAVLAGGSLGIIPIVSNERLIVRYEVLLNGKAIVRYDFERTGARAQNLWAAGQDKHGGLGKAGAEWLMSTAKEVATRLPADPALSEVREEIAYYFPETADQRAPDGAAGTL